MTIYSLRRRALVPLAGLLGLALVFAPALMATEQNEKTIYLSVVDKDGNSVTDLTAKDILIREDNQDRDVVSVAKATEPLAIVVLADTSKSAGSVGMMTRQNTTSGAAELIQDIRKSLTSFVKDISSASPESQMELMEFGQAAITVVKMTSATADIEKGINKLFPKPDAPSVLLEAIVEASKSLSKAKTPRRAIVVLNVEPGEEQSRQEVKKMNDELQKSRACLWAVSLQVGSNKNEMRGMVLEALTKNTGGRREFIHTQSALEVMLGAFADNLTSQYAVTYKRPASVAKANIVQVGVMRQGLGLHASIFAPQ
jgi:hypothetical protein